MAQRTRQNGRTKLTPLETQRRAQGAHGYGTIHLVREGGALPEAVVEIQVGDLWIPVIRELHDSFYSHYVEPLGIEDEIARFFSSREPLFSFSDMLDWVRHARRRFEDAGTTSKDTICIDAKGRIVSGGYGFQQASENQGYPVKVYSTQMKEEEN